jgi:hypothetical protein
MANIYSATLTTAQLIQESVTPLQAIAAPLKAFTRIFGPDRYKPRATTQIKYVTAGASTQTNATDFESGDSTIGNKEVVVSQLSISWQVSNDELNSGLRMVELTTIHARKFAQALVTLALAPVTEANFANYSGGSFVKPPASFSWADMALLWAALKKSDVKNAILDGEYLAMLLNAPTYLQQAPSGANQSGAQFGWDGLFLNTDWTGAGAGCRGFICHPQSIGVVAGFPLVGNAFMGNQTLETAELVLPGLGLPVQMSKWFSLKSRTMWMSLDTMFGAVALDTTAGIFVKAA